MFASAIYLARTAESARMPSKIPGATCGLLSVLQWILIGRQLRLDAPYVSYSDLYYSKSRDYFPLRVCVSIKNIDFIWRNSFFGL
jgi:hypothetical protein